MNFLVDENMPRSLALKIAELGFAVEDVRDIGLKGLPDTEVVARAIETDAIIITKDRGFSIVKGWAEDFTSGVIFVNLPDDTPPKSVVNKILDLLSQRPPNTLLGALTTVEQKRALSRSVRQRSD